MPSPLDRVARTLAARIQRDLLQEAHAQALVVKRGAGKNGRHYHDSFATYVEPANRGYRVVLMNTAAHAAIIEGGSRAHVIEVRRASVLRFESRTGEVLYRRRVNHPGTQAYRVLGGSLDAVMQRSYLNQRPAAA